MSKLQTFLNENKFDARRVLSSSRAIERLRPEDRRIRLTLSQARRKDDGKRPEGIEKPRSGKTVSRPCLQRALAGERLSGASKTRILRAVNRLLEQKKKDAVSLTDLF
jgi:hypothetical protein